MSAARGKSMNGCSMGSGGHNATRAKRARVLRTAPAALMLTGPFVMVGLPLFHRGVAWATPAAVIYNGPSSARQIALTSGPTPF